MANGAFDDIFLVGCSSQKRDVRMPAQELYSSARFHGASEVANRFGSRWFIVSAKHGLLDPTTPIDPYELHLDDLPEPRQIDWAKSVVANLKPRLLKKSRITILAGGMYAARLETELLNNGLVVRSPFSGRSNGGMRAWLNDSLGMSDRAADLERFYAAIQRLVGAMGTNRTLHDCQNGKNCPNRGVYFFFEHDQRRFSDARQPRVVRVGTHAVSAGSKATLWNRLRTHRGTDEGSGNHRSSIMRLHIGAAMLVRLGDAGCKSSWGRGQSTDRSIRPLEDDLERAVSAYIGSMYVSWIEINDEPSPLSDRAYIEQNSLGLLAGKRGTVDIADSTWLGFFSPTEAIRRSSLWNIDHVDGNYDPDFLDVFETYVDATLGKVAVPDRSIAPDSWHAQKYGRDVKGQMNLFKGN